MTSYRVLVADEILPAGLALLRAAPDVEVDDLRLDAASLRRCLPGYDAVIVRSGTAVDRGLIAAAVGLRLIARAGLALDNIDVAAATEHGIMVMHTPEAYSIAAAEHTIALLLALARHVPQADAAVRRGEWDRAQFMGTQLVGRTLGLIGFGQVGRLVVQRAQGLGMDVLVADPYAAEADARRLGVVLAPIDEVLAKADFLSLHAALTPETHHLIGAAAIAQMKPGARLINCARGELVDETALYQALADGRVAGAALDVFEHEPPAGSSLVRLPNVVLTPHLGGSTAEAQRAVSVQVAQQVLGALRGDDFRNVVNLPFISGPSFGATRPYLDLAEMLGRLQSQLAEGTIRRVEVETKGEPVEGLIKAVAVALLKGLLAGTGETGVNFISAPALAAARGLGVAQVRGLDASDYAHLISCRVTWDGGQRVVAGTLFGGTESRIVQIDDFRMDARPKGHVLVMRSRDVPGVIGVVGTLLAQYGVNIGEWRLGRDRPGGMALSFINLDSPIPAGALTALRDLPQVVEVLTMLL